MKSSTMTSSHKQEFTTNVTPNEYGGKCDNGLMECKFCGRKFNFDRILKHQNICRNIKHKPNSIEQNVNLRGDKDEWGNKIKDEK